MKYFSVNQVADSYKRLQQCTDEKFWGIMSILIALPTFVTSNVCYPVQCSQMSSFLENLFRFGNKKTYKNDDVLYVVFSSFWKKSVIDYFLKRKPLLYDLIVWSFRNMQLDDDSDSSTLISLFVEKFHISLSDLSVFVDNNNVELEYSDVLYNDSDLLSFIGINANNLNKTLKMNGTLVEANPGELSRGPFVQPLYASLSTINCLVISSVDLSIFYNYRSYSSSNFNNNESLITLNSLSTFNQQLLSAIRTKPFVLLAGISGTGKSRIVRELAKACWPADDEQRRAQEPKNFKMIQVRPNWHDSTELIGYVSRINGERYIAGDFIRFVARAWQDPGHPYFLCLDEMNLAPVEQYFAEYLSIIESRKYNTDKGLMMTDNVISQMDIPNCWDKLFDELFGANCSDFFVSEHCKTGISIPQNLVVIGTVNMDETTYSFSRKVLDRAMTLEMNEVNMKAGLSDDNSFDFGDISQILSNVVIDEKDAYAKDTDLCERILAYLEKVNDVLEGTPFRIAYRTRNEFLMYAVNRKILAKDGDDNYLQTIDDMTSMKVLSRIEGDADKTEKVLSELKKVLEEEGLVMERKDDEGKIIWKSSSLKKIKEMTDKLSSSYTSYWS